MKTKYVHDFKVLELRIKEDSVNPHTIYFKEHSVRDHTKDQPSGRTLFILNVPPYADEKGIANAFSNAGIIESVQFSTKPNAAVAVLNQFIKEILNPSFKMCYLVFKKVSDLDKALTLSELNPMNSNGHHISVGLKKWTKEYNDSVLMPKDLKSYIDTYMKNYDENVAKALDKDKNLEQEDDEGWITVTKKGKVNSFARTEKVENKILAKEEKKRGRKELKNFYTFQIRESKMKHIVALRQKFEEDKCKIAQIKQSRRFKPF
ncbi:ribosomal RNA-processing protein 7 homolog A [Leptidea sinapis]|uniref:RRM domain-containing protein n=1 Tax=Leptidea sinapis TaxID=189913 RepID=A0A5E4QM12_9NEOP|nr:ribosomal RNA-processing protein 7 homolog A [Leptidea sinapis]VVC99288.1 unnamed protein product [Leptidea sinapis]